ncbi:MAG TPA: helicase C-terminal domain-containing protein [Chthoniobacterales bacterium]
MIALKEDLPGDLAQRVETMFSPRGIMAKAKNFEHRPQQQQMAGLIAQALEEERHLLVEAGTGVGKSLAYLIPAVLYAKEAKKKAVISTHTINLQEQLMYKDIPIVQKLLPVEFEAVLLKGRQNYLCPKRLERAMQNSGELFTSPEAEELKRIWEWSQTTRDGSLSDFAVEPDPAVWSHVCSEQHICTPKSCGRDTGRRCFYQEARKRFLTADVVVTNHTMLFLLLGAPADMEKKESGYIFANDFLILDEAHTIEQVAAKHIGLGVSQYGLRHAIQRLYNAKTQKGLFTLIRDAQGVKQSARIVSQVDAFFDDVGEACDFRKGREFRVRRAELVHDTLAGPLAELQATIVNALRRVEDETTKAELQDMGRRIRDARLGIADFLTQEQEQSVYWVEKSGKTGQFLTLNAVPVDLAAHLRQMFFRPDNTCVLTSATLGTGRDDLDYFRRRVGALPDEVQGEIIGGPFDYEAQMRLYIVRKIPDPRDDGYQEALETWIAHFLERTHGRAFVLFTSYKALQTTAERMASFFAHSAFTLLVQGQGMPRHRLIEEFKKCGNGVLFGTDSFWQGVDVPGEALQNVIITRLPFAVPDHPLIEAKLEHIEARGGDPFTEFSLPEAILKFRQGVGRLIRTKQDKGIIVVLDNRILAKRYGKAFLAAMPECPVEIV